MGKLRNAQPNVEQKIARLRSDVQNERLSMSIGELAGLYANEELDIHPKFQRVLRWTTGQKTKLIESILLRIPIPPIFVSQAQDGKWDVVDGVQRLGTIFEFMGILKDAEGNTRPPLMLEGTILLDELKGFHFASLHKGTTSFSPSMKLDFRRSRLDINIILKESTPSSKYELFERLNTGGSIASPQEVRNCVLVWMNEGLFDWMQSLCDDSNFVDTTPITDRLVEEQFRMELLLRFLVLYKSDVDDLRGIQDLSEFLNARNRELAETQSAARQEMEHVFRSTFALLNESLGGDVFRKYEPNKARFSGAFLISSYEAVAVGVAHNIKKWLNGRPASLIEAQVKKMWEEPEFKDHVGIGISSSARMKHTIPFGRKHFKP